jgi:hypothetical protein
LTISRTITPRSAAGSSRRRGREAAAVAIR